MTSELDQLADAASELAAAATRGDDSFSDRCRRLALRLVEGRFHVSVLGEFKTGKSTLVNALLGEDVLPTGVLPLTAIATEVRFGEPGARVAHASGTSYEVPLEDIANYVTEERNPANELNVTRVEASVSAPLLRPGVVLVDTPGLGSIYDHDEEARRAILDADGAILVLSADTPLSAKELELMALLAERRGPTFFVLNKIDHLTETETDQVRRFVTDAIARTFGRKEELWCLSARAADAAPGFAEFAAALNDFVTNELVEARLATARNELSRLGHQLDDAVSVEAGALALDAAELSRRVQAFEGAADEQRRAFEDERTVLQRDVGLLVSELGERLQAFAQTAPASYESGLALVARSASLRRVEQELQAAVEAAVVDGFDGFRQTEAERIEAAWAALAERFRGRTADRLKAVREVAADLFSVSLPHVPPPRIDAEDQRFFYLFLHVEPLGTEIARALRWLLPPGVVRRRLLRRAREQLSREFDKHAGRARWDLSQRLDAAERRFEVAMRSELAAVSEAILGAAARAVELRRLSETEHELYLAESDAARRAAQRAISLGEVPRAAEKVPAVGEKAKLLLERAYRLAAAPLEGINEAALQLADLSGGDVAVIDTARKIVAERLVSEPDHATKQVAALIRRAFELGNWRWAMHDTNEVP